MYVTDTENHRIQRFLLNSSLATTVAGTGSKSSALTDLDHPSAVVVDDDYHVYVLDKHNSRVVLWGPNATSGTTVISNNALKKTAAMIYVPGRSDQVYISDEDSNKIYRWSFNMSLPTSSLSQVNSTTNALNTPKGMTTDMYGNLYVADYENHRIVMYCANSTVGIVVAGDTGGTPTLDKPMDIAFDSDLNMYVVVDGDNQVIKFPRR
ncbi:unnamed protein product [Adineta ricciae]|nr:unnamed protein product [Adineta ricciae]